MTAKTNKAKLCGPCDHCGASVPHDDPGGSPYTLLCEKCEADLGGHPHPPAKLCLKCLGLPSDGGRGSGAGPRAIILPGDEERMNAALATCTTREDVQRLVALLSAAVGLPGIADRDDRPDCRLLPGRCEHALVYGVCSGQYYLEDDELERRERFARANRAVGLCECGADTEVHGRLALNDHPCSLPDDEAPL